MTEMKMVMMVMVIVVSLKKSVLAAALWKEPFACAFRKMNATK